MSSFFSICCGEGEEESKLTGIIDPSQYSWNGSVEESQRINGDKKRIRQVEKQVSLLNKSRHDQLRATIYSKPVVISDDFEPPYFDKTPKQAEFLNRALDDSFIFMDLTDRERDVFVNAMQYEQHVQDDVVIEQGDVGDFFYIVEKGTVDFLDNGIVVGTCTSGGSFGELALLYDCPRAVSVVVTTSTLDVWKVDQITFRHILAHHAEEHCQDIRQLVRKVELFKDMDEKDVIKFVKAMAAVHWKEGERIVQKGEEGNVFYIVREGEVRIHDIGLGDSQFKDQVLTRGQAFGERSLLTGEPRAANVTALTDVLTLAMDRDTFEECIGSMKDVLERDMRKKFIVSLPLFAGGHLSGPEIEHLVDLMNEVCYRKGDKLAQAGKPYDSKLWIIRHGRLLVYSSKHPDKIYNLQSGDYFGDKSIRNEPGRISSHTAVCEENLTTWVLSKADIESVIGDIDRLGETPSFKRSKHNDQSILFQDLKRHRILGAGAFGKVWLVSHKDKSEPFALKTISKRKLIASHQVQSVMREKELLCLLEHPFILHMVSSYQDEQNLYLLLPVIPGGELFSQLQKRKSRKAGLPTRDVAFYGACVIEALGHFHQRYVCYRDLKLENVLLDEDGYCVIVDLGFAKVVTDKTYTLVGTPEYLAPEIIMSKGHDKAVDYWSYGVLVYELLLGRSPFYKRGSTQMDMFKRIVLEKYEVPDFFDDQSKSLVTRLLVRKPSGRLGNLANGYLDIKTHSFFSASDVDFKSIVKKQAIAPWKPELKDAFDASSNFDDYSAKEKEVDTGRRLTKEEQDLFLDF